MPRSLFLAVAAAFLFSHQSSAQTILVFGDSLSAAYGIAQTRGWVALLAERLKREHANYSVVNASISGETTSGGAERIKAALDRHRPAVVIVELGANDGLRGLPLVQMKQNLAAIVERSQQAGARVLIVGMKLPPNYGVEYTRQFEATFDEVARRHKVTLAPFFLEGFADKPELFQPDRIHPTESAQPLMLERVWKALRPLLR